MSEQSPRDSVLADPASMKVWQKYSRTACACTAKQTSIMVPACAKCAYVQKEISVISA